MIKKLSLFLMALAPLFAIDIQINPEKKIEITPQEIQKTIDKALLKRIRIEKNDAKQITFENKLLANELLKTGQIPEDIALDIKLSLEENLADLFVKQHQKSIVIDDKVLESYYKTNKKEFEGDQIVEVIAYDIKEFDKAVEFYTLFKDAPHQTEAYAKEHNITTSTQKHEIAKLAPIIKDALRDFEQANYLTAPLFVQKKFLVIYVKDIKPNPKKSFKDHKEYITNILQQKTFIDTKKALLKQLKESQ